MHISVIFYFIFDQMANSLFESSLSLVSIFSSDFHDLSWHLAHIFRSLKGSVGLLTWSNNDSFRFQKLLEQLFLGWIQEINDDLYITWSPL